MGYAVVFGVGQAAYSLGSEFGAAISTAGIMTSLSIEHGGVVLSGLFVAYDGLGNTPLGMRTFFWRN